MVSVHINEGIVEVLEHVIFQNMKFTLELFHCNFCLYSTRICKHKINCNDSSDGMLR